mgnify:CR=1 FL=1
MRIIKNTILMFLLLFNISYADFCVMPPHDDLIKNDPTVLLKQKTILQTMQRFDDKIDEPQKIDLNFIQELQMNKDGLSLNSFNVQTSFNVLAICFDTPDKKFVTPLTFFDSLMFSNNQETTNNLKFGSVKNYYLYNSYQRFNITFVILPSEIGAITLDSNYNYYVNNSYGLGQYPNNSQKAFEDILVKADPLVNFADFDNDKNGYVDGVIVFHPGSGAEFSGNTQDIWSHKWSIYAKRYDNVWVQNYSMQPEFWSATKPMTIGVVAHETGHLFGLPDLYDTDNSSRAIGKFSLMAGGSWNISLGEKPAPIDGWCRKKLGNLFSEIVDIKSRNVNTTLLPSENTPRIFRMSITDKEYYLVENLQNEGLPTKGIAIWRCDETYHGSGNNRNEWYPPTRMTNVNYWVALIQPNNLWELEKNISSGKLGCLFTAGNSFTVAGQPSSSFYGRDSSLIEVTNIIQTNNPVQGTYTATISTCDCPTQGDINQDGNVDAFDISACVGVAFEGEEATQVAQCQYFLEDVNCDLIINSFDVITMINNVIRHKDFPKKFCQ